MQPNDLPLLCLPMDLSDEAAAQFLEFLQDLAQSFERHYAGQLSRHYRAADARRRSNHESGAPF